MAIEIKEAAKAYSKMYGNITGTSFNENSKRFRDEHLRQVHAEVAEQIKDSDGDGQVSAEEAEEIIQSLEEGKKQDIINKIEAMDIALKDRDKNLEDIHSNNPQNSNPQKQEPETQPETETEEQEKVDNTHQQPTTRDSLNLQQIVEEEGLSNITVRKIGGSVISSHEGDSILPSATSTIKLPLAVAVIDGINENKFTLDHALPPVTNEISGDVGGVKLGEVLTVEQALKKMLMDSSNTAANLLKDLLDSSGGVNNALVQSGFNDTSINRYINVSNQQGKNDTNADETSLAMQKIFTGASTAHEIAQDALENTNPDYQFAETNGAVKAQKYGLTSTVIAGVSLIEKDGEDYIVSVFKSGKGIEWDKDKQNMTNALNKIHERL